MLSYLFKISMWDHGIIYPRVDLLQKLQHDHFEKVLPLISISLHSTTEWFDHKWKFNTILFAFIESTRATRGAAKHVPFS